MRQKDYVSVINKVTRDIKREQRKNAFKYVEDTSQHYVRWTVEQLLILVFVLAFGLFSISEFTIGLLDKSEPLLGEGFHSFFHCLGAALSLFCLCYTHNSDNSSQKDPWYPYGRRKLNILAGFVNSLNTIFTAFFVLIKQSHFLLDDEHGSEEAAEHSGAIAAAYTKYSVIAKSIMSILMMLRLRRYLIYVTKKRSRYIDIKEFYTSELKSWRSKHDNLHSFSLILFHQSFEKTMFFVLNFTNIWPESNARNTLLTIGVSILCVFVSFPLFSNTFINLIQGLSGPHTELIDRLKKELNVKFQEKAKVVESQFWQLDMSTIVGSMRLRVSDQVNSKRAQEDYTAIAKEVFGPFVRELTIETESGSLIPRLN